LWRGYDFVKMPIKTMAVSGQGVFEARDLLMWYNSNFDKGNK
jgi:hypothetical protein